MLVRSTRLLQVVHLNLICIKLKILALCGVNKFGNVLSLRDTTSHGAPFKTMCLGHQTNLWNCIEAWKVVPRSDSEVCSGSPSVRLSN
jgi:hypothetical protein